MKIMADYREKPSGIIEMLIEAGLDVAVGKVSCGDYIINNRITLERKTASDFVVSIISGRLFKQAARLKTNAKTPLLLVEGNPFKTEINISHTAVRGAILTIQSLFYLPIVYGRSKKETVDVISHMARLVEKNTDVVPLRGGYRPRKLATQQLFVLQGLPGIGPRLAKRLLNRMGSVRKVMNASSESLNSVNGIGLVTAGKIWDVLNSPWDRDHGEITTPYRSGSRRPPFRIRCARGGTMEY